MYKVFITIIISAALLFACGDPAQRVDGIDKDSPVDTINTSGLPPSAKNPDNIPDTVKRCYIYAKNLDTITLQVLQTGKGITGTMNYHFHEKDNNDGYINGTAVGDTLVVDYTFKAEGTTSTRQEVLLKKGEDYLLGSGETEEQNGKMVFKNRSKLQFGSITLAHVNCTQ